MVRSITALALLILAFAPQRSEAAFTLRLQFNQDTATDIPLTGASGPMTGTNFSFSSITTPVGGGLRINDLSIFGAGGAAAGYSFETLRVATNNPGMASNASLTISWTAVLNLGSSENTVTVSLSADGFTLPPTPVSLQSNFNNQFQAGAPVGNVEQTAFIAPDAGLFSTSGPSLSASGSGINSTQNTGLVNFVETFSLTNVSTFSVPTFLNNGTPSGINSGGVSSFVTFAAPAPAAGFMAVSVLPLIALALRRRRQDTAPAVAA